MKRVAKYQDGSLIPGSPDVYDFLVRQGIVDPNTTSKEEVMKLSPDIIKGLVKQSGMVASGTTPGAVTIAQRPLLMAQKTEIRTPSFEDVFAAAPDGSIFEFEGKKYKKEYSKDNKIVKRQASKEDIQTQYVVDQLANFQLGGMVNRTGYTPGTETFNNPINVIPGGKITMKQTPMPVLGIGSKGKSILMQPGKDYNFGKVDYVTEIPVMQTGGATTAAGKAQELYKNQLANKSLESVFNYTQGIPGLENLFKQDYSKATPMNTPPLALALPALMSLSMSNFSNNNIDLGKQITSARDGQYIQHAGFGDFMGKVWNGVKTVGKYATKAASFIPGPIGMIGGAAHSILYPSGFGPKQEQLGEVNQMQQQQVPGGMMSGGGGGLDFGSITQLLGMLPQIANMQDGGEMQQPKTPIQAESHNGQDEIIILPDGTVAPVNAVETHKQMPKNEITDVVEAGSYVASAFPKMAITRKEAEKIPVSFSYDEYEEGEKGDLPELKTLDQYIFKGKERKVTPAKAIERVAKDYSITEDKDDLDSYTDVYLKRANEQNKMNRTEIIQSIITLAEGKKKGKKKDNGIAMAQEGGYYGTQSANLNGTPIIYNEPLISVQPLRSNNYVPTINPQQLPHQFTGNTATNAYLNPVAPQQSSGSSSGGIGSLISIGGDIYSAIQNAKTAKKVRKELATQYANVQQAYANQAKQLQSSRAAQLVGNLALNTDRIDTVLSDSAYRNINPTAQRNTIDAAGQRLQGSVLSGVRNNPYLDKLGRQALTAQTVNQLYDNAVKGSDAYFNSTFQKDKGIMDTANQNTQFRSQEDMRQQGMQNQQTANTFSTISSGYLDQAGMELARQRELNNIAMMSILGPAGYNQAIAQNVKNIGGEVNAAQNSIINTVKSVI